jgi:hypothetical protein
MRRDELIKMRMTDSGAYDEITLFRPRLKINKLNKPSLY